MRKLLMVAVLIVAGCGKKSGGQSPVPGVPPPPAGPSPSAAAEWRASLEGATIPAAPAAGQVRGEPFTLESAVLEDGILHLKQGKEFFADKEFILFLFVKEKGSIPENRTWDIKADKGYDRPHIHVGYKKPGQSMPDHDMFMSEYSMKLELGKESGKKIPGKIWLCVKAEAKKGSSESGETRSWVAGTFTATVKGFILRDGQADRTEDSLELLSWLAEERLQKENAGKKVKVTISSAAMMTTGEPTGTGSTDVDWTLDGMKKGWLKCRFEKSGGVWALSKLWPADQIPEAHPEKVPDLKAGGEEALKYLTAVHLEKALAGKVVHMQGGLFPQKKDGVAAACEAGWQVEGEDAWVQKTLLFKWTDAGWAFDRELKPEERFNARTGTVEAK